MLPACMEELDKHGKTYELRMYRNAEPRFLRGLPAELSRAAAQDMWHRVLVFYEQYLTA